jgi:2-polyprenyl-3-methyl-5-hydroxy-6-metoxy-1,4-benzoquinol methylase
MIYMFRLSPPPIEYGRDYFFDQYRNQYGKTYLEDFPHLVELGKARLHHIRSLGRGGGGRLLDIGCAYGPFLAAACEAGYQPAGIDPAEDAAAYVRKTQGLPVVSGFFPQDLPPELARPGSLGVVTLWYVIEHFPEPRRILARIAELLEPGGVLAFSTPSGTGISARVSRRRFLERSPADHWTIWTPGACRKLLRLLGFQVRKIVSTGHHPERFPLGGGLRTSSRGLLYGLCLRISQIFRLGDTFEVYAVKSPGAGILNHAGGTGASRRDRGKAGRARGQTAPRKPGRESSGGEGSHG